MMLLFGKNELAVMATYRRTCRFNIFVHLLGLLAIHGVISSTYSIFMTLQQSGWTAYKVCLYTNLRKIVLDGRAATANLRFPMAIMRYSHKSWPVIILIIGQYLEFIVKHVYNYFFFSQY